MESIIRSWAKDESPEKKIGQKHGVQTSWEALEGAEAHFSKPMTMLHSGS